MHRGFLHAFVACIALAVALLVPLRASATILPACENRELFTPLPLPSILFAADEPAAPDPACGSADDANADPKVAPICDPRGASAVAPPRVVPVNDASIEASGTCEVELTCPMIGPAPRDASMLHSSGALVEPATIAAIAMVQPALSELGPAYPPVRGETRTGIARGVYHPPR